VAWGTGALASLARAACAPASLAGHRPFAITGVALAGATSIVILLAGSLGAVPQFPFEHYQRDPRYLKLSLEFFNPRRQRAALPA